jgi:nucleotide-binding universal stress UspA family protein
MYRHILIPVEHSDADKTILAHVQDLARLTKAKLLLLHVADGWAARNYEQLELRESEEIKDDRAYLGQVCSDVRSAGFEVDCKLAMGDPASEILKVADEAGVDLIAMATHGHRFIADMIKGATADRVRHLAKVPVLMIRHEAKKDAGVPS